MKKYLVAFFAIFSLITTQSCKEGDEKKSNNQVASSEIQEDEDFRPNFHFSPKENWMNDPNGMFYKDGTYHLYFQHYPDDNVWGPMHWGHATSKDMVKWEEQPIAIYPDSLGYIFSGSAVVDKNNTSGFAKDGKVPVVAIYTYHDMDGEKDGRLDYQYQAIAYSLDDGKTFTKYEGNPVIPSTGIKDFRDPKVSWDAEHKQWLMSLAAGQEIIFYSSKNLKDWKELSRFGEGIGNHNGVWECPDLFPLKVDGSGEEKWVLLVSINPGGPNEGSATQYFIGDFDGKTFKVDDDFKQNIEEEHDYWVDFGKDNYAGVTWSNIPDEDGRKLFLGWMSNWLYGQEVPTETWRSAMTIAREIKLIDYNGELRLISSPVRELNTYEDKGIAKSDLEVSGKILFADSSSVDLSSVIVRYSIDSLNDGYQIILENGSGDELVIGYEKDNNEFYVDRSNSGRTDFSEKFTNKISTAPRIDSSAIHNATLILDAASMEIFFDDGKNVMTEIFFPKQPYTQLSIKAEDGSLKLNTFSAKNIHLQTDK
ncbi:glycoside hydrolase family 32 protein [Gramella sp. AN32]|uniref:Glycoside hydrolase family 32 protein n=1 Tax=Christiangramia antarctica TaxID=2058158 RepID=A0ABW5XCF7_9FLAO|nr:glycoside hydrolase family 32 protein [Gramella sp. AN32]MCM4155521.1 glycosyl hydrolase family 32 [Gramella sp. AN32]